VIAPRRCRVCDGTYQAVADGDGFTSECCPRVTNYLRHDWLRSVRCEARWRLRVRTTRWPLSADRHCDLGVQVAAVIDGRLSLADRDVEIRPSGMLG
jgi:hypothetical protein